MDNLRTLAARMTKLHATFEMLRVGLDDLGVARNGPAGEDAHAEIRLPAGAYDGSLGGLARESEELNDALFVIVEAATGARSLLTVRVVSTGASGIVVSLDLASATLLLSVSVQLLGHHSRQNGPEANPYRSRTATGARTHPVRELAVLASATGRRGGRAAARRSAVGGP